MYTKIKYLIGKNKAKAILSIQKYLKIGTTQNIF